MNKYFYISPIWYTTCSIFHTCIIISYSHRIFRVMSILGDNIYISYSSVSMHDAWIVFLDI